MMATTVVVLYIAVALVASAFLLEAAERFSHDQSVPLRNTYAAIGGVLWPILLVGLIQVAAVAAFAKWLAKSQSEHPAESLLVKR